jgi:hypothetical protein
MGIRSPRGSASGKRPHHEARSPDMLAELRRRNPRAAAPQDAFAVDPHKAEVLISPVLEVFNSTGLTAQQARDVLAHLQVLID